MKNRLKRASFLLLALAILLTGIPIAVGAEAQTEQAAVLDAANDVGYSQADAEGAGIDLASIQSLAGASSLSASVYKIDSIAAYTNFVTLVNNRNTFSGKNGIPCRKFGSFLGCQPAAHRIPPRQGRSHHRICSL